MRVPCPRPPLHPASRTGLEPLGHPAAQEPREGWSRARAEKGSATQVAPGPSPWARGPAAGALTHCPSAPYTTDDSVILVLQVGKPRLRGGPRSRSKS